MKASEQLKKWYETERAAGRVLDIKFFPCAPEDPEIVDKEAWLERACQQVLDIVTGKTQCVDVTDEEL